jgi:biotin carboxyl carrier protein
MVDDRGDGMPTTVEVDGQKLELLWSARHGVLVVTAEGGLESHIPVRASHVTRYPGEAEVQVHAELWALGAGGMRTASAVVLPDVPHGAENGAGAKAGDKAVRSPITGKVLKVLVKAGETVTAGQALVIVEAMKMENRVFAPGAGVVKSVSVKDGDAVTTGKELVRLAPPAAHSSHGQGAT